MSTQSIHRLAAACGIIFVALLIVAFAIFQAPMPDDSAAQVRADLVADRELALTQALISGIALAFLAIFVAEMATHLRRAEGDEPLFGPIAYAAGVLGVGLAFAQTALFAGLTFNAEEVTDNGTVRALYDTSIMFDMAASVPMALFILALSAGMLRTHEMDRWVAWLGLLAGVLTATRVTGLFAQDGFWSASGAWPYIGLVAAVLWLAILSVVMMFPRLAHHEHPAMPQPVAHA